MRKGFLLGILTLGFAAYLPLAYADYITEAEFANNGNMASTLENALDAFLMPLEVQLIGNAVYNDVVRIGAQPIISPSSSPKNDFVSLHTNPIGYCSPSIPTEATAFQCTGAASSNVDATTAQLLEMGDIRPSILLEPLAYNSASMIPAINLIRNLTAPFPSLVFHNFVTNLSSFQGNSNQKGSYANYMASQAYLSVARYALDEIFGMRVSGSSLSLPNGNAANNTSIMQIMEDEATRRYANLNSTYAGGTNSFLTVATPTQLAVDMAAMQAFQLWMDYHSYRQNERIAALLSAILSNSANASIQTTIASVNAGAPPQ